VPGHAHQKFLWRIGKHRSLSTDALETVSAGDISHLNRGIKSPLNRN
jgi:hypothetical protein